eukprot:Nk52_evm1s2009 gene=Nk52_evmTU1s2009
MTTAGTQGGVKEPTAVDIDAEEAAWWDKALLTTAAVAFIGGVGIGLRVTKNKQHQQQQRMMMGMIRPARGGRGVNHGRGGVPAAPEPENLTLMALQALGIGTLLCGSAAFGSVMLVRNCLGVRSLREFSDYMKTVFPKEEEEEEGEEEEGTGGKGNGAEGGDQSLHRNTVGEGVSRTADPITESLDEAPVAAMPPAGLDPGVWGEAAQGVGGIHSNRRGVRGITGRGKQQEWGGSSFPYQILHMLKNM